MKCDAVEKESELADCNINIIRREFDAFGSRFHSWPASGTEDSRGTLGKRNELPRCDREASDSGGPAFVLCLIFVYYCCYVVCVVFMCLFDSEGPERGVQTEGGQTYERCNAVRRRLPGARRKVNSPSPHRGLRDPSTRESLGPGIPLTGFLQTVAVSRDLKSMFPRDAKTLT